VLRIFQGIGVGGECGGPAPLIAVAILKATGQAPTDLDAAAEQGVTAAAQS
jgi:hypothetical protein